MNVTTKAISRTTHTVNIINVIYTVLDV